MKIGFWKLLYHLPFPKRLHDAAGRKMAGAMWDAA